jgi:hypothetical protein
VDKKAVFDFLATKENFDIALEIANYINEFRDDQHRRFWTNFNEIMTYRVGEIELENWRYLSFNTKNIKKMYGKCYIVPVLSYPDYFVKWTLAQTGPPYSLYWGVEWNEVPGDTNISGISELRSALQKRSIDLVSERWVHWANTTYTIIDGSFLARLYHDPNQIVGEIVDRYLNLFMELRPFMDAVNQSAKQLEENVSG